MVVGEILIAYVVIVSIKILLSDGLGGLAKSIVRRFRDLPGIDSLIGFVIKREAQSFLRQIESSSPHPKTETSIKIPEKGVSNDALLDQLKSFKANQLDLSEGQVFAYVYTIGTSHYKAMEDAYLEYTDETSDDMPGHDSLCREYLRAFMHENALNPIVFPALRRFETETVAMAADMLHGDGNVVGSLTSGGTESILMAIKTYRDRARDLFPHIKSPEMVAPITIHPAFEKAAHYFDVKMIHVPLDSDFKPNMEKYRQAITPQTILLLGSAPQYCHGVVDPIEAIGKLAEERGIPFHVDACFGGFMLPWVEKLGYPVPKFDFRVPAVSSISADVHKYGYGLKGASLVLYRTADIRKYQLFTYSEWPGGLFGSPGMTGTRPGGNIAASWAALKSMGQDGYLELAKRLMDVTGILRDGIRGIPGLAVLGSPHMTAFAIASTDPNLDILVLADAMEEKGWKMERQQLPNSLHCTIMPHHIKVAGKLVEDLRRSTESVRGKKAKAGTAAVYGMVAKIPDKAIVDTFVKQFLSDVYSCK